jgi:hypothetical protein
MTTRREKHVLIIAAITIVMIIASGVDQETLNQYEYLCPKGGSSTSPH